MRTICLTTITIITAIIGSGLCSIGDRMQYFGKCLSICRQSNCSNSDDLEAFNARQPPYLRLMGWNCPEECRYQCQWRTVSHLLRSGAQHKQLPQFYGKWTFIRLYGMEEPASVIFSVLNLLANIYGWNRYRKSIQSDRYFIHWTVQTLLTINAWFWSAVFHVRQSSITEKFDYFSAYSLVIYSLFTITVRFLDYLQLSPNQMLSHIGLAMPFLAFYVYHIHYLFNIHFDYGYNMRVNVITGLLSSLGWLFWCLLARQRGQPVLKCLLSLVLLNSLLLLELYDFPPIGFVLDAHSLWHFGTIVIPIIWFRYSSAVFTAQLTTISGPVIYQTKRMVGKQSNKTVIQED